MYRAHRIGVASCVAATLATMVVALPCSAEPESAGKASQQPDAWERLQTLEGEWGGIGVGKSGRSRIVAHAQKVLQDHYILIVCRAAIDPEKPDTPDKLYENWAFVSYDKARKKPVIRQFNAEGYVNQYVLESISKDGNTLVFVTEQVENGPPGLRARITYRFVSDDEYEEEYDLAFSGKDFETHTKKHLGRSEG